MPRGALFGQRKAAVAVIFAISALPIIGLIGLAVDFGVWNQSNAALSVAANVAALTAVKVAANAQLAGDQNATTEGQVAGQQWFLAEIGNVNSIGTTHVTGLSGATVKVTGGATLTATVSYQGNVPSIFGNIFAHIGSYPINGQAVAVVSSSPYLNIEILLDNSGSMEIGATNDDIIAMQKYTPCSYGAPVLTGAQPNAPGAFYLNADGKSYSQLAGQSYNAYATAGYTGSIPTPAAADPKLNLTGNAYPVTGATGARAVKACCRNRPTALTRWPAPPAPLPAISITGPDGRQQAREMITTPLPAASPAHPSRSTCGSTS